MVIGYVGKLVYYLQRVNGSYRWNGLRENAAIFTTKQHAEHAIQSTYSKIKPIIVIV
jgi:hypothetical protein